MNSEDLWTKRLKWVKSRNASKNKYEKILLGLKIARYDHVFARRYGNTEGKKKARDRISDFKRRLKDTKLGDELKAIETAYENSKKQIEYDKKLGYTFSEETRKGKKYLYKQKRTTGSDKRSHEYLAKNWDELDTKQNHQAQGLVWEDRWALKDLTPSEIDTFNMNEKELPNIVRYTHYQKFIKTLSRDELDDIALERYLIEEYERQKKIDGFPESELYPSRNIKAKTFLNKFGGLLNMWDPVPPDPILEKACKKLGMNTKKYKNKHIIVIKHLPTQEVKNILRATRKALIRRGNIDKKIESMALMISEGNTDPGYIEHFIAYIIKDSGALNGIKIGGRRIGPIKAIENYINGLVLRNPKCMYSVLEPVEVRVFAENVVNRFKGMGGSFSY